MKDRTDRIEELEAEMRAREATFHISEDIDEEIHESFFGHVLSFEDEPETTIREQLITRGHEIPSELWELIARLAEMNIVIELTDHLDDAELFEKLLVCLDELVCVPNDPNTIMHVPMAESEDAALFLRYYATDADRELWRRDCPDEEIPPRESLPFDRDRFLPKAEDLRSW